MKPVLFALLGMMLYAVQSVALEQKLSKYTTAGVLLCFYLTMLPLALIWLAQIRFMTHQPILVPSGWMFLFAGLIGALYFVADCFYVGAYTSGGSVFTITTIAILFPVFAFVVRYLWVGGFPNAYQISGFVLAALAVLLVTKGSVAGH